MKYFPSTSSGTSKYFERGVIMLKCPECGREFKNRAGLSGHLRLAHGQQARNAKVPADTLERIQGKLEQYDGSLRRLQEAIRRLEASLSQQDLRELREAVHQLGLKQEASEKVLQDVLGRLEELKPQSSHISPPSEQAKPAGSPSEGRDTKGFDWGTALLVGGGVLVWLLLRKRSQRNGSRVRSSTSRVSPWSSRVLPRYQGTF